MNLPDPVVEEHGGVMVVREDLLLGGSKRRGVSRIIADYMDCDEFVYASPAYGYAQVALAVECREYGKRATIFVAARKQLHDLTAKAMSFGAAVHQVEHGYLSNVTAKARRYCGEGLFADRSKCLLPFGLDDSRMVDGISEAAMRLGLRPREVWCAGSSCTLTRSLQSVWPEAKHFVVRVGAEHKNPGIAVTVNAPEKYEKIAKRPPPFPSCPNYDAKVWQFVEGREGALYWNM